MQPPKGMKGESEARKLAKSGRTIAAASHLWRVNQPVLGLREAKEIAEGFGYPKKGESVKIATR